MWKINFNRFLDRRLADLVKKNTELRAEIKRRDEFSILDQILNVEETLGYARKERPKPEEILSDANSVIQYSNSTDYKIWSKEVWSQALKVIDDLQKHDITDRQIDFLRGKLEAIFDILRISYKARFYRDSQSLKRERERPIQKIIV